MPPILWYAVRYCSVNAIIIVMTPVVGGALDHLLMLSLLSSSVCDSESSSVSVLSLTGMEHVGIDGGDIFKLESVSRLSNGLKHTGLSQMDKLDTLSSLKISPPSIPTCSIPVRDKTDTLELSESQTLEDNNDSINR
jgi:hypothetical protein